MIRLQSFDNYFTDVGRGYTTLEGTYVEEIQNFPVEAQFEPDMTTEELEEIAEFIEQTDLDIAATEAEMSGGLTGEVSEIGLEGALQQVKTININQLRTVNEIMEDEGLTEFEANLQYEDTLAELRGDGFTIEGELVETDLPTQLTQQELDAAFEEGTEAFEAAEGLGEETMAAVDAATEVFEIGGEIGAEEAGAAASGFVASIAGTAVGEAAAATMSLLGPAAAIAGAGFLVYEIVEMFEKEHDIQEKIRKYNKSVADWQTSNNLKLAIKNKTYPTIREYNDALDNYYRGGNAYISQHTDGTPLKVDGIIEKLDTHFNKINETIDKYNNFNSLYVKWVLNEDPDNPEHTYRTMGKASIGRALEGRGHTIPARLTNYLNDNYHLENTQLFTVDSNIIDHWRSQVFQDENYDKFVQEQFDSGKYNVENKFELDLMKPPIWSIYYTIHESKFKQEDKLAIASRIMKWRASKKAEQEASDIEKMEKRKEIEDIRRKRQEEISKSTKRYEEDTFKKSMTKGEHEGKDPSKEKEEMKKMKKDIEKIKKKYKPPQVFKEWSLEKADTYDPNLSIMYKLLSSMIYDIGGVYDSDFSNLDERLTEIMKEFPIRKYVGFGLEDKGVIGNLSYDNTFGLCLYSPDRNEIVVIMEGTDFPALMHLEFGKFFKDVYRDLQMSHTKVGGDDYHTGFYNQYKMVEKDVEDFIKQYNKDSRVVFTGHSAGGAISQIGAYLHAKKTGNTGVINYNFASPRAFGSNTADNVNKLMPYNYRINMKNDIVPMFPLRIEDRLEGYKHAGREMIFNEDGIMVDRRYKDEENVISKNSFDKGLGITLGSILVAGFVYNNPELLIAGKDLAMRMINGINQGLREGYRRADIGGFLTNIRQSLSNIMGNENRNLQDFLQNYNEFYENQIGTVRGVEGLEEHFNEVIREQGISMVRADRQNIDRFVENVISLSPHADRTDLQALGQRIGDFNSGVARPFTYAIHRQSRSLSDRYGDLFRAVFGNRDRFSTLILNAHLAYGATIGVGVGLYKVLGAIKQIYEEKIKMPQHARDYHLDTLEKNLKRFKTLGVPIKDTKDIVNENRYISEENEVYRRIGEDLFMNEKTNMVHIPQYHKGEVYMVKVPRRLIKGIYFYRQNEFRSKGNIKGFAIYH